MEGRAASTGSERVRPPVQAEWSCLPTPLHSQRGYDGLRVVFTPVSGGLELYYYYYMYMYMIR